MKEFKVEMSNGNVIMAKARSKVEAMEKAERINQSCGFHTKAINVEEV